MADPSECFTRISHPCLQRYPVRVCLFAFSNLYLRRRNITKGVDRLIRNEDLPGLTKTQVWLNDSNRKMWNVARVPRPNCDVLTTQPQPSSPDARSIVVLIHDFFYAVEVYSESRKPHTPAAIERQLWSCVRDVQRKLSSGERAKPIGILTTDDRDRWAKVRFLLSD
jgi:hypothetical protein